MGEYLSFREKIEELRCSTVMRYEEIAKAVDYGTVTEDFERNRVVCRRDVRKELRAAIEESGLSQASVARFLGLHPQHLNSYLKGKIALSNDRFEEVLFLLDGRMRRV